jgi:modification methylase
MSSVTPGLRFQSTQRLRQADARELDEPDLAELILTSPPYPLVGMWDPDFGAMSPAAAQALERGDGAAAFEAMHQELDRVWRACFRALVPGGFCCINIGDAARSLGEQFSLWPNHARILSAAQRIGFTVLPDILWRKPTNAPNKFMGSGMLPAGAYVTYEHEYVLILRKGGPRRFSAADATRRRQSAFFWEERNLWFSDTWSDVRGTRQEGELPGQERSGSFPIELASRLIAMYSLYQDRVLDPFGGLGTTALAAAMAGRSSLSLEWSAERVQLGRSRLAQAPALGLARQRARLEAHRRFVADRLRAGKTLAHHNAAHDLPVITGQERELVLLVPTGLVPDPEGATLSHGPLPPPLAPELPLFV